MRDRTTVDCHRALVLLGTLVGLSVALGGCNTTSGEVVTASVPEDYRLRHPIVVEEANHSIVIFVGQERGGANGCRAGRLVVCWKITRTRARGDGSVQQVLHYWARRFVRQGHTMRLLPARDVRPLCSTQQDRDRTDAAGLLEADRCAQIDARCRSKSPEQQGVQALHRIRELLFKAQRTATSLNLVRGVLREFGIVIALGAAKVRPAVLQRSKMATTNCRCRCAMALADMLDPSSRASGRRDARDRAATERSLRKTIRSRSVISRFQASVCSPPRRCRPAPDRSIASAAADIFPLGWA